MIFRSQFTTLYKLKVLSSGIFATVYDANVTSGDVLSTVDMVVQQRDGPRWPRKHDDDDDMMLLHELLAKYLPLRLFNKQNVLHNQSQNLNK